MNHCIDKKHSLYISRFPVNNEGLPEIKEGYEYADYLTPEGLMYLCSDTTFRYEIDYPMMTYVPPTGTSEDAILIDNMAGSIGRITVSGDRIGDEDTGSNRWFDMEIEAMMSNWQIQNNAYLLRLYNSIGTDVEGRESYRGNDPVSYKDIFVYISEYVGDISQPPNVLSLTLKMIERNMLTGLQKSDVDTIFLPRGSDNG